jgi:SAM-dependent methyltransferase
VDHIIERHNLGKGDLVLDCFSGSGTTPLCAELKGIDAVGLDLSPLMTFVSSVKTRQDNFSLKSEEIEQALDHALSFRPVSKGQNYFPFLKETRKQFSDQVLESLCSLKLSISERVEDVHIRDLFMLAFTSVLVQCSNLKRSPCLGYANKTDIPASAPYDYFSEKVRLIIADLEYVRRCVQELGQVKIQKGDSTSHKYENDSVNLAITSPPYANGLDYVTNYKIELAWLGSVSTYEELRSLRNSMVASDNVSRGSIDEFFDKRTIMVRDPWLEEILANIRTNVKSKKTFRRRDMHLVIQKYFEDMFDTFQNVFDALVPGGKFVLVIGDSLTAGTYLPTDLILARIGRTIGFDVEDVEFARNRRSGQRRSFKLRESIVTLSKES